jgi:hypothetical protein
MRIPAGAGAGAAPSVRHRFLFASFAIIRFRLMGEARDGQLREETPNGNVGYAGYRGAVEHFV